MDTDDIPQKEEGGGGNPAILFGILHGNRGKLRSFGPLARGPLWPFLTYQAEGVVIVTCDLLWHEQYLKKDRPL